MKLKNKKLEDDVREIVLWIVEHSEETAAIDKINSVTFPFTSKYINYQKPIEPKPDAMKKTTPDDYDFDS